MIIVILTFLVTELVSQGFKLARLFDIIADYVALPYWLMKYKSQAAQRHYNAIADYRKNSTPGIILKLILRK